MKGTLNDGPGSAGTEVADRTRTVKVDILHVKDNWLKGSEAGKLGVSAD